MPAVFGRNGTKWVYKSNSQPKTCQQNLQHRKFTGLAHSMGQALTCTIFLMRTILHSPTYWECDERWVIMTQNDHVTFFHISAIQRLWLFASLNSKCAFIFAIQGLCNLTLQYPHLCNCGQPVSLSDSLIMPCIHILGHLKNSCSPVFPYTLQIQLLTMFTDGFLIDLNWDVTLSLLSSLCDWSPCHLCLDNEPIVN